MKNVSSLKLNLSRILTLSSAFLAFACNLPQEVQNELAQGDGKTEELDLHKGFDLYPISGSASGGESVIIEAGIGTFDENTKVSLGGTPCTNLKFVKSSKVICTTPAHKGGTVDLTFETQGNKALVEHAFTFIVDGSYWIGPASKLTTAWTKQDRPIGGINSGYLSLPTAITSDSKYIYVADGSKNLVNRYDVQTGKFFGSIGPRFLDGNTFQYVSGVAADGKGNVYVLDGRWGAIFKFDAETAWYQGWVGRISGLKSPFGGMLQCSAPVTLNSSSVSTPAWCFGGSPSLGALGSGDAGMYQPRGIFYHNGQLYVGDNGNTRIARFNADTGEFTGWIGLIIDTNGISANCQVAQVPAYTPGWCIGGKSLPGANYGASLYPGDGLRGGAVSPYIENGILYVSEYYNGRIMRFNLESGAFMGWIGSNYDPVARKRSYMSGWVSGGAPYPSGYPEIGFSSANVLSGDGNGHLFVVDSESKIKTIDINTGAYLGYTSLMRPWSTTPASFTAMSVTADGTLYGTSEGAVQRFSAYTGEFTGYTGGKWFIKKEWKGNDNKETIPTTCPDNASYETSICSNTRSFGMDSSGNTYHSIGSYTTRITKFSPKNEYIGWIGLVDQTPTGGAAGCTETLNGQFTPGWCTGGKSSDRAATFNNYGFSAVNFVMVHDDILYVSDTFMSRITRFDAKSGRPMGWIGAIKTAGLKGSAACEAAKAGQLTPGWCSGGSPDAGYTTSLFGTVSTMTARDGKLYLVESRNSYKNTYLSVFDLNSGAKIASYDFTSQLKRNPNGIAVDKKGVVYITAHETTAIYKINGSTGEILGWTGGIYATTGLKGSPECLNAPKYSLTPGWCVGGTSGYGVYNNPASLYGPRSVVLDEETDSMYVLDGWALYLKKFSLSTGRFVEIVDLSGDTVTNAYNMVTKDGFIYILDGRLIRVGLDNK